MSTYMFLPLAYQYPARTDDDTNAMTVAHAAPCTPIPRPKMNIGSRIMFTITPRTWISMERLAAPSPRSIPDITPLRTMKKLETYRGVA